VVAAHSSHLLHYYSVMLHKLLTILANARFTCVIPIISVVLIASILLLFSNTIDDID